MPQLNEPLPTMQEQMELWQLWASISQDDKDRMLAFAREFVQSHWRDAHIVYQDYPAGKVWKAAIGVGKHFYDDFENPQRKQPRIQLLTEWKRFDYEQSQHETELILWFDAYCFCRDFRARRGQKPPEWDYHVWQNILLNGRLLRNQ